MTDSDKARTNKKWTSTEKYRDNYDRIFGQDDFPLYKPKEPGGWNIEIDVEKFKRLNEEESGEG